MKILTNNEINEISGGTWLIGLTTTIIVGVAQAASEFKQGFEEACSDMNSDKDGD